jgi:hypothetical protein
MRNWTATLYLLKTQAQCFTVATIEMNRRLFHVRISLTCVLCSLTIFFILSNQFVTLQVFRYNDVLPIYSHLKSKSRSARGVVLRKWTRKPKKNSHEKEKKQQQTNNNKHVLVFGVSIVRRSKGVINPNRWTGKALTSSTVQGKPISYWLMACSVFVCIYFPLFGTCTNNLDQWSKAVCTSRCH